jgi:hypothetical protein
MDRIGWASYRDAVDLEKEMWDWFFAGGFGGVRLRERRLYLILNSPSPHLSEYTQRKIYMSKAGVTIEEERTKKKEERR